MKLFKKKQFSKNRGLALLAEVLVAFTILLFVSLGAMAFFVSEKKSIFHAAEISQSSNLARSVLESYIYGRDFDSLVNTTDPNYQVPGSVNMNFIYNIAVNTFSKDAKLLVIKMYPASAARAPGLGKNEVNLPTIVYRKQQ